MQHTKEQLLENEVKHLNITEFNAVPVVNAMAQTAFQGRNLGRAAKIYEQMLRDDNCTVILCLAGSLISAGMKQAVVDMINLNMVDAIVSTGANIVDQDFFEGLGFKHYQGSQYLDDNQLRDLAIDRIYDTLIDEDNLRVCDNTICEIADGLPAKPYSSREFIYEMGRYLVKQNKNVPSLVQAAFEKNVPIFCPAFSDCSAGFGLSLIHI